MDTLNDSVIICDESPKLTRRKVALRTKTAQKNVKRTYYESPLKHIKLSKIWEQLQAQKRLSNGVKRAINDKKKTFSLVNERSLQDSIIVLSDNESESNKKESNKKYGQERKRGKRSLELSVNDKQISQCNSNETLSQIITDISAPPRKRQKKNITFSENSSSCFLKSNTKDCEIATIDLYDENKAPVSNSVNQGSDEIVVVWSSTNIPSPPVDQSKNKTTNEDKDKRIFMIDNSPNPKNLSCLECSAEVMLQHEKKVKKNDIENKVEKEQETEDFKCLPFSKSGLKLPKAHNIIMCKFQSAFESSKLYEPSNPGFVTNLGSTSQPYRTELSMVVSSKSQPSIKLREIVIDGNNVAMAHKNGKTFSEEGIMIVIDYFKQRGHSVKVFVPQHRRSLNHPLLEKLYTDGIVIFTPSRNIAGRRITPYDDRFILEYATMCGGIVVSLDQYRDLYMEKPEWRDTIENRLLAPTFVGDYVMFPEDPLGRKGPKLEEFLRY
ncbi:putative ribonuclease ZC3H12B [Eufriesea mexicana]|nr:putative ribonuclease ZC3H12B [Eufriesea mexicana]